MLVLKAISAGVLAGFFSGLLGIGSGSIIVPILYFLFSFPIKTAIGTSLFVIFFSSLAGFLVHMKEKNFDFKLALLLIVSGVTGAQTGAHFIKILPDNLVKIIFVAVIVSLGFKLFISDTEKQTDQTEKYKLSIWKGLLIGFLAGVVSGLCGVGGAIFLVPLAHLMLKVPIKVCIGTGLLVVFFNALSGTISYGIGGYINYEIGVYFVIGAVIASPVGAKVSIKTPRRFLRKLFGLFLMLTPLLIFLRK